jgi:hypothetical protein
MRRNPSPTESSRLRYKRPLLYNLLRTGGISFGGIPITEHIVLKVVLSPMKSFT